MKRTPPVADRKVKRAKCEHPKGFCLEDDCPPCEVIRLMRERKRRLQKLQKLMEGVNLIPELANLCGDYVSVNE